MKTAFTPIAELEYNEEEMMLHIRVLKNADMNLVSITAHYDTIHELTEGKKYLALVDAGEYFTVDPEALQFAALPETIEHRLAAAHYNPVFANKLTADFFRKFNKPSIPVRTFPTKEEAIEWLMLQAKEKV